MDHRRKSRINILLQWLSKNGMLVSLEKSIWIRESYSFQQLSNLSEYSVYRKPIERQNVYKCLASAHCNEAQH